MKCAAVIIGIFLLSEAAANAQSNRLIDELLESSRITAGQMSYILLAASEELTAEDDAASAFRKVSADSSCLDDYDDTDAVPLDVYLCALMSVLDIKGGIMYSIFRNPRYAFIEMVFRGIIKPTENPSGYFNGEFLLSSVQRVINWRNTYQ